MGSDLAVEQAVVGVIREVLEQKGISGRQLSSDTPVSELGLDSLDWAVIVVRMEEVLACDPFSTGLSEDLRTVADLVSVYEAARARSGKGVPPS